MSRHKKPPPPGAAANSMPPPTMGRASLKGKEASKSRAKEFSGSKECSRSTGSSRRMDMDPPDVPMDMGEPVEIMCEPAWMSSQMPTMQTLFGMEIGVGRGSSRSSKGKATAFPNASPPSTQAVASASSAPRTTTTRPPTSRNLSRSTSRSSVTSTSTTTSLNDQPRPPPAALDDLVQRVTTNAASTMLAVDSRIIRHTQESGRPLTTMKARAIGIGFAVDKYGRSLGQKGKGRAPEKVAPGDVPMEVDLAPPPRPQTGRGNALARKDSRSDASSLPTPAPSRTNSLNKGVEGTLPLPPPPALPQPPPPAAAQQPSHTAFQPPPYAAPNRQQAALTHSPPSPQKGAEPQAKRRRVEPDENIGYQPALPINGHAPPIHSQAPSSASQTPAFASQAPSQRKQLGMRPARRMQPDKPETRPAGNKDRAHPRPFRPPLMASQTPNADANRVPPTTHPQGKSVKPPSGGSAAKDSTTSANGAPPSSGKAGATPSSKAGGRHPSPASSRNPSPPKVPAAKCRSGRPPLALEEVPDSEEEDEEPSAKQLAPKRDSSPPADADSSFDWDGAVDEMNAKGIL